MNKYKAIITEQLQQLQMITHRAMFHNFAKIHNPHRGQGRILAILKLKPLISQKELTYLLDMSKQSVAELIMKLEKSGYITREPSDDDKRVMMIKLTEAGSKAADDAEDTTPDILNVLDCLNDDELANLSDYLGRIIKKYEEQFHGDSFDRRRAFIEKFKSAHNQGFEYWENSHRKWRRENDDDENQ